MNDRDKFAKIQKILENHEKRIKKLEGLPEKTIKSKNLKAESASSFIIELKDEGFFKAPKTFSEIQKELERRGHYYNRTSLSKPLLSVVRKKILGRVGKKGNWKYVGR